MLIFITVASPQYKHLILVISKEYVLSSLKNVLCISACSCSFMYNICKQTATAVTELAEKSFTDIFYGFYCRLLQSCHSDEIMFHLREAWGLQVLLSLTYASFFTLYLFFPESLNNIIVIHKSCWVHKYAASTVTVNHGVIYSREGSEDEWWIWLFFFPAICLIWPCRVNK